MKIKQIKRVLRILFIIASLSSLTLVPWILVKAWILPLPDTVQEQLNDVIDYGFDGMVVYVDEAGKPPAFYAAGWKDRKNKIPADPHALFKIASITKLYVAVAATKLVKANRLSLDKTLADYFPELIGRIEYADAITLRMMLQHRSGIPNYTDHTDYWVDPPMDRKVKLSYALDLPASFKPDRGYEYSNTNYMLISDLIDKVLGYPHQQYIKEEILLPLNLHNTYGSLYEVDLDDVMSGYYVGIDEDIKTDYSGLMIATAEDVGIFLRALNDGSVFNDGEQEIYSSVYVYDHGGLLPGYQSLAKYHKDADMVVVQFMNTTNFDGYHWNLSQIFYNRIVKIINKTNKLNP
ncbi:serine-type D-Ala-D-Ala carboxypeptidase [Polaribacter pacificus]|uniref:Serine-type D-Ala-D-Ala carboxypeptidase n=1 Tax=Polaribacter pacificus TaxID=1775173 RepID=A0A917HZF9_9FLAO|nr:serine hydrolase domain-containing protein [Polaribacter pacificus]GGG97723.1 serine-type D-Ala-D-Ala carboxypeptidase [Polaribacter pacificus]